ncbi:MAG: orotate phosphoribosyltransferase [Thermoanaerobaculia bacterium]|nr:orotate phosphoribosyltransferase [Thermoanaerobaculia bacterium]
MRSDGPTTPLPTDPAPEPAAAEREVLSLLEACGALRRGHFLLSSGLHSAAYVQCALLLEEPRRARRVGELLAARFAASLAGTGVDSVLSPARGGVIVGHEVAAALGVPFRFAERDGERLALRRGFSLAAGERVVVIEDVVTTGKSTRETAELALAAGAEVVGIGAILDRSPGPLDLPTPLTALARLDLPAHRPEACPLCAAGSTPEKPGSRPRPSAAR